MQVQNIYDESGNWIVNSSQFAFVDPTNGCRFEPSVRTKALVTAWVKSQPVLKVEEPEVVEVKETKPKK